MGINWFCCGYSRGLELVQERWAQRLTLGRDETILVVVATRISRITDYGCSKTGGLFGDMASATLLSPLASRRHPVHFRLVHARAERQPAERRSSISTYAARCRFRCSAAAGGQPPSDSSTHSMAWVSPRWPRGRCKRRWQMRWRPQASTRRICGLSCRIRLGRALSASLECSSMASAFAANSSTV